MTIIRITEDLPCGINGMIIADPDGNENIYINDSLSPAGKRRTLAHELQHRNNNDLWSEDEATDIEARTQ